MGFHGFKDSLHCTRAGINRSLSGSRFFSSVESNTLKEIYDDLSVSLKPITAEGTYSVEVKGNAHLQPLIHVLRWKGEGSPVIIFHHSSNERPVDYTCKKILLSPRYPIDASIVLVQAACHESGAAFNVCAKDLSSFATMVALSARVIDEIVAQCSRNKIPTLVAGVKLGGWVANFHHAVSNSATSYFPVLAGAGFGDIFIDSSFSSSVSSVAKKNHQKVRRALNFDDLFMARSSHSNVYPLLARYDRISDIDRQSTCYGDLKITILNKGHITGSRAFKAIRAALVVALRKTGKTQ